MATRLTPSQSRGTTLVELLTAMAVFLILLSVIMSFYTSGARLNRQQDQRLETMRRSLRIADRLEVLLSHTNIMWVGSGPDEREKQVILFAPLSSASPYGPTGANWDTHLAKVYLDCSQPNQKRLVHIDGQGRERLIGTLHSPEEIEISGGINTLNLDLKLLYYPDNPPASPQDSDFYTLKRTIPIYNHEEY